MKHFKVLTLLALLLVLAVARGAQAQFDQFDVMGMMRGMQFGPLTLLTVPQVRKELKLSKAQDADLKKLQSEHADALKKSTKAAQSSGDPTKMMEMAKEMETLQAGYGKRALELMDEAQRKRFGEIRVQVMGFRALLDKEIGTALTVTDGQKASLSVLDREYLQAYGKMVQRNARTIMRDKEALMAEYKAKALQVLSAEQGARFTAMEGAPFKDAAMLVGF